MRGVERMVNWGSGKVREDNHSESLGVVRSGAMAPHWPGNRVYLFPVTSAVLRPERIWYTLPNWQWVVPSCHLTEPGNSHPHHHCIPSTSEQQVIVVQLLHTKSYEFSIEHDDIRIK